MTHAMPTHTPTPDQSSGGHDMTPEQTRSAENTLRQAIDLMLDGNVSELARRCGVRPQAALAWLRKGVVPARRVPQVCAALEGCIDDWELRPDIFRRP